MLKKIGATILNNILNNVPTSKQYQTILNQYSAQCQTTLTNTIGNNERDITDNILNHIEQFVNNIDQFNKQY